MTSWADVASSTPSQGPHQPLPSRQRAMPLVLMASGATRLSNSELRERYGFAITGSDRIALNKLGLVSTHIRSHHYIHELTDSGWAWCAQEISATRRPVPGQAADAALVALTAGLNRYIDRTGKTLVDIFGER